MADKAQEALKLAQELKKQFASVEKRLVPYSKDMKAYEIKQTAYLEKKISEVESKLVNYSQEMKTYEIKQTANLEKKLSELEGKLVKYSQEMKAYELSQTKTLRKRSLTSTRPAKATPSGCRSMRKTRPLTSRRRSAR